MMKTHKQIEWIAQKAQIERDIYEDYGQKLLQSIKEIDEKEPLSTKLKLTLLNLYMKHCPATCLTREYYIIQLKCSIEEYAKEELLSKKMLNIMLNMLIGNYK